MSLNLLQTSTCQTYLLFEYQREGPRCNLTQLNTAQNPRVKITFCCLTWFIITQFKDLFNIYDWTDSWAATQEAAGWNFQSSLYILKRLKPNY